MEEPKVIISNDELYSYLDELENDEEDIRQKQAEIDSDEALEASYGNDAWTDFRQEIVLTKDLRFFEKSLLVRKKNSALRKQQIAAIKRMAFSQELIDLSAPLTKPDIKRLIALITQKQTHLINKHAAYIHKKVTTMLTPLIPQALRRNYSKYPQAMLKHPGFLYKAHLDDGTVLPFWARPDIPYYFEQGTEQDWLESNSRRLSKTRSINEAVRCYYKSLEERTRKEVDTASIILQKGINTYLDLVKFYPFWFELMYNDKKVNSNAQQ